MTDSNSFQSPQFPLDLNAPQGNQSPTSMMGNSPGVDDYVPPVVGPQAENTLPKSEPLPDVIASPQLPAQPKPISLLPTIFFKIILFFYFFYFFFHFLS